MAPSSARRVSYVVPSPSTAVPKLRLPPEGTPRNGQIGPILIPSNSAAAEHHGKKSRYPRHRLGVAAFALDTSTQFVGRDSPEGILYSGGRDGMVMMWDLGMAMKQRVPKFGSPGQDGSRRMGRWEKLTIDEDDDNAIYEEEDDEWLTSDGDVLGDVIGSGGRRASRYWSKQFDIPYGQRWELDVNSVNPGQPAYWRKHVQAHTDWVNDLLLCNLNQTVVSASSDGTVKAWSPHSSAATLPSTIGTHTDYARCLSQCHERKWIASGSFDRTIKLWDMAEPRVDPLMTLVSPDAVGPKSSVYALASDPSGHVIAAGGPERVVRTWDPRSGKRTGKLVGHTDNIRAILMSEDSRYLLTGSADASIKLWSILSPQRCIYTFTHHTESVWSLFSSHPALETFYSGDRSGLVCRVDVEECQRVYQGECTLLCKDDGEPNMASSEGVSKIIAMDDHLVWTASGSSSIRRWRVPQSQLARAVSSSPLDESSRSQSLHRHTSATSTSRSPGLPDGTSVRRTRGQSLTPSISASLASRESFEFESEDNALNGIPYESLIKLCAPNGHHGTFSITSRSREAEVSTLYSATSAKSLTRQPRSPTSGTFPGHAYSHPQGHVSVGTHGGSGRRDTLVPPGLDGPVVPLPNTRLAYEDRDVAPDATPLVKEPDLVIEGEHGLVRVLIMNDRMHALTVDTTGVVAVWDIVRCQCLGVFAKEDVQNANKSATSSLASSGDGTNSTRDRISPRQALEIVRDRIEGEAVVNTWSNADTKIGELTIHISERCFESEIFADEAGYERIYSDDHRLNIGKWALRNLFMGFIREEQRLAAKHAHEKGVPSAYKGGHSQRGNSSGHPRALSDSSVGDRVPGQFSSTADVPPVPALPSDLASGVALRLHGLSPIAQSPVGSAGSDTLTTPKPATYVRSNLGGASVTADEATPTANPSVGLAGGASAVPTSPTATTTPSATTASASHDYFSLRRRPSTSQSTSTTQTAAAPAEDDFSGWGGPGSAKSSTAHETAPSTPSTPGGGLMGRLKNLGKSARRAATEAETPSATTPYTADASETKVEGHTSSSSSHPKSAIERLKSQPITPPSSHEAPVISLPSETAIIVSEELPSGWSPVYRGTVGCVGADAQVLEEVLPEWLLEFLLANKAPPVPLAKLSFVLLPAVIPPDSREIYGETLPELLNTAQSKLSASRFLRVKKLTYHVQEKLDKNPQSKPASPRSSSDAPNTSRPSLGRGSPAYDGSSSPAASRSSTPRLSPMHLHNHGTHLPRAEDVYEILCNDQVLSLEMTLAAVRQFVWRSSGELIMYYRRKARHSPSPVTPGIAY
ncbi:uncharacterized protein FOMMEDRAFT_142415 [Fomitiporia mediterranea MF3/22]|uniref:uncharacterized protein n=1 Tax=Fomitiporia mediterranea (strain MF3/22) TaxID=694068 RepID=UPI00044079B3|nr:uncharacterized protein FOMMEDRAFT_142415 [Fomitiporia mediterranea MF3/22]EJD00580.1 hypothetical protein FOMMEDRAFT_142415 [Fomitiporia mediterranea MF3/22]